MNEQHSHVFAHTVETVGLAIEIADISARTDIECICVVVVKDRTRFYDIAKDDEEDRTFIATALRYMALRGDALPYRVLTHPLFPTLYRFEDKPA